MNPSTTIVAPSTISYDYLGLGNIIKINFNEVIDASGYIIEKYNAVLSIFEIIAITRTNSYVDYSNQKFSSTSNTLVARYRLSSISCEDEISTIYSQELVISIPEFPEEYRNLIENEDSNSEKVLSFANKEDKLVVYDEGQIDFHKLSALDPDPDENLTDLFIVPDSLGYPVNIKESNDNHGMFIQYNSGSIVKYMQNTLAPIYTLPTVNKTIVSTDYNSQQDLFCILEIIFGETVITTYDVEYDIVIPRFPQIKITDDSNNFVKIVDFKISGHTIFVLDELGRISIYEVDFERRSIDFHSFIFKGYDYKKKYNHFYKRAALVKTHCIELLNKSNIVTNQEERDIIKSILLNDDEALKSLIDNFRDNSIDQARNGDSLYNFSILTDDLVIDLFNIVKSYDINLVSDIDINDLVIEINTSHLIYLFVNRTHSMFAKMLHSIDTFDDRAKMHFSDDHNSIIVTSPFFFKIIDLQIYKISDIYDCISPNFPIKNYLFNDIYPPSLYGSRDDFDEYIHDEVERFIEDVDVDTSLRTVAIHFNDVMFQPIFLAPTEEISYEWSFNNRYIDYFKLDINGIFSKTITEDTSVDTDFTFFKGFGYPLLYNFSTFSPIFVGNFYFFRDKAYKCIVDRMTSDRNIGDISSQLENDVDGGYLKEVNEGYIDSINFVSRLNITSRINDNSNERIIDMFEDQDVALITIIEAPYDFFVGETLFTNADNYKNADIGFTFDKFGSSSFVVSYGAEPGASQSEKICGCFFLYGKLYPDTNIIFTPNLIFNRSTYIGTFSKSVKPTDEAYMFLAAYNDTVNNFVLYIPATVKFNSVECRKIYIQNLDSLFDTTTAVFIKRSEPENIYKPAIKIYNDYQTTRDEAGNFYGNNIDNTWRWENDTDLLLEGGYISFRVSLDKEPWVYLPKASNSYTGEVLHSDGSHIFSIQYQKNGGSWSETFTAYYHLKRLIPLPPVLLSVESSPIDRGKPTIYWSTEPGIDHFRVVYNNSITYNEVKTNYHSPKESFSSYSTNSENIKVNVFAYDKYGNISEGTDWLFAINSHLKEAIDLGFDRYTNNLRPTITWLPKPGESLSSYSYRFDNSSWIDTTDLFAIPEDTFENGIHSFEIFGTDSLGNETYKNIYYFEINTNQPNTPAMTEETIQRTTYVSPSKLYFNMLYSNSDVRRIFSFDNFKHEYEFFGAHIDATNITLPAGNNTIYIKYFDKYNNESEVLEFTFYLNKNELLAPRFVDTDSITSNTRPIWAWKTIDTSSFVKASFYKDDVILESVPEIYETSFSPKLGLDDGSYRLELTTIDKYDNESSISSYTISVNTSLPSKPFFLKADIFGGSAVVSFNNPRDGVLYGSLIRFSDNNKRDIVKFKPDSQGNFYFKNLIEGQSYILEVINYGDNSLESLPYIYTFVIKVTEEFSKLIYIQKDDKRITIKYFPNNGRYAIVGIDDFNYDNNILVIDNVEVPLAGAYINQNVRTVGFKTDTFGINTTTIGDI